MKKTTFTVAGARGTRKSHHAYTHCCVVLVDHAHTRANFERSVGDIRKSALIDWKWHASLATGAETHGTYGDGSRFAWGDKTIAEAKEVYAAANGSGEAYADQRVTERRSWLEARLAETAEGWTAESWHSSAALAQKAAAKLRDQNQWPSVEVREAIPA